MRRNDREVRDIDAIEDIIRQCKTCHVAMIDDGKPYVIPLSYGYRILSDNSLELYFHSAQEGRKIDIFRINNKICFEMAYEGEFTNLDNPCHPGYHFGSVVGYGEVAFINDVAEKREALSTLFKHQTGKEVAFTDSQAASLCMFKIVSADFTGKRKPKPE